MHKPTLKNSLASRYNITGAQPSDLPPYIQKNPEAIQHLRYSHLGLPLTPSNMKRVHQSLRCVLKGVDEAFAKTKIRYSVSDGTLLGLKRNGKFILWDDDADARVHDDDWNKLKAYSQSIENTSDGYRDGELLWDHRLGTDSLDVQVTCEKPFKNSDGEDRRIVHMDVVKAAHAQEIWKDMSGLFTLPLERVFLDGDLQVSVAAPTAAVQALVDVYGEKWRVPSSEGGLDETGLWKGMTKWGLNA